MAYNCGEATSMLIHMRELQKDYQTLLSVNDALFELFYNSLVTFEGGEDASIATKFEEIVRSKIEALKKEYVSVSQSYIKLN